MTAANHHWRKAKNTFMQALTLFCALLVIAPLGLIFFHLVKEGIGSVNWNFFTKLPVPVGENGGGMVGPGGQPLDAVTASERAERATRLGALVSELRAIYPELEPADDASERLTDFTFDIGEHRRVDAAIVAQATEFARARRATTHVSSVHLHVGFDAVDKASGVVRLLRTLHGLDATAALKRYAFIGDSENDAACFNAFRTTVGVANLRGRPTLAPRFMTQAPRGAGVAELARVLGALRASAE